MLGRRLSALVPMSGGSSMQGDSATLGDVEKLEHESEISDGARSTESATDASDTAGDVKGASSIRLGGGIMMSPIGRWNAMAGRAKDNGCSLSSKSSPHRTVPSRRMTRRRRRFIPPFHQFLTALSLRPLKRRAISAQRLPISPTSRSMMMPSSGVMGS